ncbi:MAG TPA: 50S ribosomal protein L9 [Verrucomicrobia bacterium]|nr:MAG: 50S ribosomal protein L9 [Lentisphaerae bacterium GWF2_57_35]HBA85056.1 50S ribosomal protein L9 [Verrucomicrobiota bacterium]
MAKEVILMSDVNGLGTEGDVVRVAEGYARNYLLPRNLAAPITETTRRRLEKKRKERADKLASDRDGALAVQKSIEAISCTITVKTGAEGKLFGSVTVTDILGVLKKQGVELQKQQLVLAEAIRETGVFNIPVKLHPEVQATLKVWVVEE